MAYSSIDWLYSLVNRYPTLSIVTVAPFILIPLTLVLTRVITTLNYHFTLPKIIAVDGSQKPQSPPLIPYTIPFLGHAQKWTFFNPRVGEFWTELFKTHPRSSGACSLYLGGQTVHILFSPPAVEAMFKIRRPTRLGFALRIVENVLGVNKEQFERHLGLNDAPDEKTGMTSMQRLEEISHNYLLERHAVNDLTAEFVQSLKNELDSQLSQSDEGQTEEMEKGLCAWLQPIIFQASVRATFGTRLLETYPKFVDEFFEFDMVMQSLFFGTPRLLNSKPYQVRDAAIAGLERWHVRLTEESKGIIPDPDGPTAWDPLWGSRYNRARQQHHVSRGMTLRSRAGLDLGFVLALGSNAIPATLWMLLHILDPNGDPTLLGRVMEEVTSARRDDGTLDVPTLVSLPLLQSIYEEVLRLYLDALVTRNLQEDITLPLDFEGKRKVLLKKDAVVMAPSWLGHRDEESWTNPPANQFYAERFIKSDPATGKTIFSTAGTAGKLFPYGGGKTMCPGRVFAKQEMLASVALVLSRFEFEFVGFSDERGKSTNNFPGVRDALTGSVALSVQGDMRVKIRNRKYD